MRRTLRYVVLGLLLCQVPAHARDEITLDTVLIRSYMSDAAKAPCQHILGLHAGKDDSTYVYDMQGPHIRSSATLTYGGLPAVALVIGCGGTCDLLIVDSATTSLMASVNVNLPSIYASLWAAKDYNADGIPELPLWTHSGSHMAYISFISLYPDSLVMIRDTEGQEQLAASDGRIELVGPDSTGVYEVVLEQMQWPSMKEQPPPEIYRFNGRTLELISGQKDK